MTALEKVPVELDVVEPRETGSENVMFTVTFGVKFAPVTVRLQGVLATHVEVLPTSVGLFGP